MKFRQSKPHSKRQRKPHSNKIDAERKGRRAENIVAFLLRLKGYRILGQRVKTPKGEIDIIAKRFKSLVFIEVKARRDYETGVLSVTQRQAKRIISAANYWRSAQENYNDCACRFDIVIVNPYLSITHLKSAFDETGNVL